MSPPIPQAPRILLVMMSALGDVVHALPVVTALKRAYPAATLTWMLQPGPAELVAGHPDVDETLIFPRTRGWRAFPDARRLLAGRRFDLVLDLQVYFKATVVTAIADAPVKLGFDRARARDLNWLATTHRIPPHPPQHVQDQYFEFLRYLGVDPEPLEWKLGPRGRERDRQREFYGSLDRPAVALVIGSSDPEREWLPERWAELSDLLYGRYGLQPLLVGGRSTRELQTARAILRRVRHPLVSTLGVPLREMVGILDGAALTISVNTGPLHVAVALDRPVIGLMAHLNPRRTGPYRYRDLMVDAYGEPGEEYPVSQVKRPGGMQRIDVSRVLEKVELWRARYGGAEEEPA